MINKRIVNSVRGGHGKTKDKKPAQQSEQSKEED